MSPKSKYNIDAEWFDPCDPDSERRRAPRFRADLKVSIAARHVDPISQKQGYLIGPGVARDFSLGGVRLVTKHALQPNENVRVTIPADFCPPSMGLPKRFNAVASVVRIKNRADQCKEVCLSFHNALRENIEFAMFIDALKTISQVMVPSR